MWKKLIFSTVLLAGSVISVNAAPVQFGSNAYELVLVTSPYAGTNNSWATASAAAQASSYLGVFGHLVTITSAGENNFLAGLALAAAAPLEAAGFTGAWIGGRAGTGWLAGPENGNAFLPTYSNFGGGEPNNDGFAYMAIALSSTSTVVPAVGFWLDDSVTFAGQGIPHPNSDPVVGYFVEYENIAPIPLPAGLPLLISAFAALGFFARRRRWS